MIYKPGECYSIPCVQIITELGYMHPGDWAPVILPKHADPDHVDFPWDHYHLNLPFLMPGEFKALGDHAFATVLLDPDPSRSARGGNLWNMAPAPPYIDKIYYQPMLCRRYVPKYPHQHAFWMDDLSKAYEGDVLRCGKCPHRGIDLSTIKPRSGRLACPGHGLVFEAESGRCVSHHVLYKKENSHEDTEPV